MKVNPINPIQFVKQYFTDNDSKNEKDIEKIDNNEQDEENVDWYEPSNKNYDKFLYNNKGILYARESRLKKKKEACVRPFVIVPAPMYGDPQSYSAYVNQNENNEFYQEVKNNKKHKSINRIEDWIKKHFPDNFDLI